MAIPTNGLYFYAPLAEDASAAITGQALSKSGTITYQTVDGIPCAYFDGTTSELYTTAAYSSFDPGIPFSGSCHIKATANNATTKFIFISMSGGGFGISIAGNTLDITVRNGSDYATVSATITLNQWHHVVFVASATELKLYVDNTLIQTVAKTGSYNAATLSYPLSMGCSHGDGSAYFFNGHLAAVRLYNVVLTDDDVTKLSKEFAPPGNSTTGALVNGLFLSSQTPKANQRGLLIDRKFFIPMVEAGGGSSEYYRCASVNTTAKTWTGYKAGLTDGVYAFASTLTSGLTYTSVTPVAGSIYSADGLVKVDSLYIGIPSEGLIFHAPLSSSQATAATGQTLTTDATVAYQNFKNIPCAKFTGSGGIISLCELPGKSDRSMSIWTYVTSSTSTWLTALIQGGDVNYKNFGLYKGDDNTLDWSTSGMAVFTDVNAVGAWHNFIATWDYANLRLKLFVDGILKADAATSDWTIDSNLLRIGIDWVGYLAGARVYNKNLTQSEIAALAAEFTPTA